MLTRALTPSTGGEREIELDAENICQLRGLGERYPNLQPHLKDGVAIAIDGEIFRTPAQAHPGRGRGPGHPADRRGLTTFALVASPSIDLGLPWLPPWSTGDEKVPDTFPPFSAFGGLQNASPAFVLWLWRWWDFRAFRNDYGAPVKRILITGMSGTGKSTVVAELAARGHHAIDLDSDTWSEWVRVGGNPTGANSGHDWLWNETKLAMLLAEDISETLFVSGCASNMGKFVGCFDDVVLLSAPIGIMLDRVRLRTNNPYGKQDVEIAQIKENVRRFEPRLRRIASQEIDTSLPIRDVLETILKLQ